MLKPPHEALIRTDGFRAMRSSASRNTLRTILKLHHDTFLTVPLGWTPARAIRNAVAAHYVLDLDEGGDDMASAEQVWRDWQEFLGAHLNELGQLVIPLLSGDKVRKARVPYVRAEDRPAPMAGGEKMSARRDRLQTQERFLRGEVERVTGVAVGTPIVGRDVEKLKAEIERLKAAIAAGPAPSPRTRDTEPPPPRRGNPTTPPPSARHTSAPSMLVTAALVTEKSNILGNTPPGSDQLGGHKSGLPSHGSSEGESPLPPPVLKAEISPNQGGGTPESDAREAVPVVTETGNKPVTAGPLSGSAPTTAPPVIVNSAPVAPARPASPIPLTLSATPFAKLVPDDAGQQLVEILMQECPRQIYNHPPLSRAQRLKLVAGMVRHGYELADFRLMAHVAGTAGIGMLWDWMRKKGRTECDAGYLLQLDDECTRLVEGITAARAHAQGVAVAGANETSAAPVIESTAKPASAASVPAPAVPNPAPPRSRAAPGPVSVPKPIGRDALLAGFAAARKQSG